LVSGDAIIQASATMTVGIIFLVRIRESLDLPKNHHFLTILTGPMALFYFSALLAVLDLPSLSGPVFALGIFAIIFVVFFLLKEARDREESLATDDSEA
jgi:hypothetical protein